MGGRALSTQKTFLERLGIKRVAAIHWTNLALFTIIAASLLGAVLLIFQTIEAERAERAQVQRTTDVLIELRNLNRAALNAETGQRGYLITLDRRYLEPFQVGREQYRPAIARLRELLGESITPRQSELLDQIENLAETKFAEMEESVALLEDGQLIAARRRLLTDQGQEVMGRLRRAIGELEQTENRLLMEAATQTARAEARVLPLLGAMFALLVVAILFGYRLVTRAARAEAEAAQAAALGEARDRADLLARELNHRVKNLFAVILAIVRMSGKDTPEAKPVVDSIADRIQALLTAHEVTQGALDKPVASLKSLIETTLAPYRSKKQPGETEGPEIMLPAKQVTPLGLVLHELTTNAVKYGCWSSGGTLRVTWALEDDLVKIRWREECNGDGEAPSREGFGSLLMTSAARQLRGTIERSFTPDGVAVDISLPAGSA